MTWITNIENAISNAFSATEQEILIIIADVKQGITVTTQALGRAAAWVVANGPVLISDAQQTLAIVTALETGGITIPASIMSGLGSAIEDLQKFVGAVTGASAAAASGAASAYDALAAYGGTDQVAVTNAGFAAHQRLKSVQAAAMAAVAEAGPKKSAAPAPAKK